MVVMGPNSTAQSCNLLHSGTPVALAVSILLHHLCACGPQGLPGLTTWLEDSQDMLREAPQWVVVRDRTGPQPQDRSMQSPVRTSIASGGGMLCCTCHSLSLMHAAAATEPGFTFACLG